MFMSSYRRNGVERADGVAWKRFSSTGMCHASISNSRAFKYEVLCMGDDRVGSGVFLIRCMLCDFHVYLNWEKKVTCVRAHAGHILHVFTYQVVH